MTTSYGTCKNCGTGLVLKVSHSDKNPNREYITCPKFCKGSFRWKDQRYSARDSKMSSKPKQFAFNEKLFTASVPSFILPAKPTTQTNEIPSEIPSEGGIVGKMEGGTGADESALSFLSADKVATERIEFGKSESKEIVPSSYQKDIYGFVENGSTNATVNAVAGSGKTTTLVGALEFTSERARVGFIAFNRHIVQELQQRAPDHVHVSTVHSLGLANLKQGNSSVRVEKHKLYNLWSEIDPYDQYPELKPTCARLVDLCKSTMREPTPESIRSLIDFYEIDVDGDIDIVLERVPMLFHLSLQNINEIDFTDMVYLTATGRVPAKKFDYLFIDETQDFSPMQFALAKNSLAEGGRILATGDEKQAIYGFGGAGIDSMRQAREMFGGEVLPLTICYRCPKKVVRLAQQIVPEIQWRDDAPEGIVDTVSDLNKAQSGDMILCRLNAPLVKPYFNLIRNGVRAVIRGRDVGDGLISMLMRGEKKAGTGEIVAVLRALEEYVNKEVAKLISANKYPRALSLQDQFDTIIALAEDDEIKTAGGIRRKIAEIFSDTRAPITLSSVHRAKGLESKRVFILHLELLPYKRATLDWQIRQEWNVKYIAITRAKEELYFVEGNGL